MAAFRAIIACAFTAFTTYIWVTASTFVSQPGFNESTFYVVIGVSLHAANEVFRYMIPALMASMAVGRGFSIAIYVLMARCCCCCCCGGIS
ncbi:hypothetical protein QIS74_12550 [Colletotrichum tabaci]|uniref:Uncharacterized protein n=1 Tax=Colletotrichum tabaci TaxID=1209068 RepID=A0AAV9STY7_9PEZI